MAQVKMPMLDFRYKEVFILKLLYEALHDWLNQNEYFGINGNDESIETLYSLQETPAGKTFYIWWRTHKQITPRIIYHLNVDYLGLAINDVETVKENKKTAAQKGEIDIFIEGIIEIKDSDLAKSPLIRPFADFFTKRIMKNEIEMHKKEFQREMYRLHGLIKKYFELHQFIPEKEAYHPGRGLE